ncbi:MAG: ABC-three component system protein [Myxococcota bacterium]
MSGKFVIQAKHTESPVAKFSDPDFSSDATSILTQELERIQKLVSDGELEHYLLFSNRRLAGVADAQIRNRIMQSGTTTVELFGIERLDLLLKVHPQILSIAGISEVNAPLRVSPDDLATVIKALEGNGDAFEEARKVVPSEIQRTNFAKKNQVNGLSADFAGYIKRRYLSYFEGVKSFLAHPSNADALERYLDAVAEFNEQIIAHREDWPTFDRALVNLQRILFQRDGDLSRRKRVTKLIIYYMYWNCDLGEISDASSNKAH